MRKQVSFARFEVENWAKFSGDWNPIHFDEALATRHLGISTPIVHGMLAMMPVKHSFSELLESSDCTDQWWKLSAMLRRPIPRDACYAVNTKTSRMQRLKIALEGADVQYITSTARPDAVTDLAGTESGMLSFDLSNERYLKFFELFPGYAYSWLFYDAVLFSQFVTRHFEETLESSGLNETLSLLDDNVSYCLLQIGHSVTAHSEFFRRKSALPSTSCKYGVSVLCRSVASDLHNAMIRLPLFVEDELLLVQDISLMARLQSSH